MKKNVSILLIALFSISTQPALATDGFEQDTCNVVGTSC